MKHAFINFYQKYEKIFFLWLSLILGFFVLLNISDYQPFLSQGDHGRDLYAFKQTLSRDIPYIDYWWVYGPLMPYYYALFFKLFGISIKSIILGKSVLILLSSIFFYLTLCLWASPILAFLATAWLFLFFPDFFFTYNHAGGIAIIFALMYYLLSFLKTKRVKFLYYLIFCSFLLCLIKINFGIFALFCSIVSLLLIDFFQKKLPHTKTKKPFYLFALIILPSVIFIIYYAFLYSLPFYEIKQCLPYLAEDHPYNVSLLTSLSMLMVDIKKNVIHSLPNVFLALLINLSLGQIILLLFRKGEKNNLGKNLSLWTTKKEIILIYAILCLFYVCFLHEFFASGVFYRSFWGKPFVMLLMFITISFGTCNLSKPIKTLLHATLLLIIILEICSMTERLKKIKNPFHYFPLEKAKIYTRNSPAWLATATYTVNHLKKNLKEEETFLAIPYDPLYYYLTDKKSPTRQLIFFDHINIPKEQEEKIISELEKKQVNWIVLSNRSHANEPGLGRFGVTYCVLLGEYIRKNFEIVAQFGDWINEPLWSSNHGTRVLRRISEQ